MRALVTGTTGLLGNNVVRALLRNGAKVRTLVRSTSSRRPLENLPVETFQGDVVNAEEVRAACADVDLAIHAAADVRFGWTGHEQQYDVNVQGSQNVAEAAAEQGIRMIHVSSVDALAVGKPDKPADELTPVAGKIPCPYVTTKYDAERAVLSQMEYGLDVVIVNPAFMLGPWDWTPSSGRMLIEVAQSFTPFAPSGGMSLCDARDVADGILAAIKLGKTGQRYILAGENMSYFEAWKLFANVTSGSPPWRRAGPLMRWIAGCWGDCRSKVTGKEGDINSAAVRASSQFHYYNSGRAEMELGYRRRPVEQTVVDAWNWFMEFGYV